MNFTLFMYIHYRITDNQMRIIRRSDNGKGGHLHNIGATVLVAEVEALVLSEGEAPAARVAPRHQFDYRRS